MEKDNSSWVARLPLLIQSKVARQYLSAIFKSKNLEILSKYLFSPELLKHKISWLNSSDEFFEFFELLGRIEPGFYFHSRDVSNNNVRICGHLHHCYWVDFGFYVMVGENFLKFEYLDLSFVHRSYHYGEYTTKIIDPMKKSLSSATEFLKMFVNTYERYDNVNSVLYCSCPSSDRVFLVNRAVGEISWMDGKLYRLKKITYFPEPYSMNSERDEIVTAFDHLEMKIYKLDRRNEWNFYERVGKMENVMAKNLVESMMSDDGKNLKADGCPLELEIRVLEKNEGVLVRGFVKSPFFPWEDMDLLHYSTISIINWCCVSLSGLGQRSVLCVCGQPVKCSFAVMDQDNFSWIPLLPLLIQSKIARQYLSAIFKSKCLKFISERVFSPKLLEHKTSWLNFSDEFFDCFNFLRRIEPGFYFPRRDSNCSCYICCCCWGTCGFYVTFDENSLKFQHVDLINLFWHGEQKKQKTSVKKSLSSATEFLKNFTEHYDRYDENDLVQCFHRSLGTFWVNRLSDEILWTDGFVYPIGVFNIFCHSSTRVVIIFDEYKTKIKMFQSLDDSLEVNEGNGEWEKPSIMNLTESVMDDGGKTIIPHWSAFEIEIEVLDKNESVSIKRSWFKDNDPLMCYMTESLLGE